MDDGWMNANQIVTGIWIILGIRPSSHRQQNWLSGLVSKTLCYRGTRQIRTVLCWSRITSELSLFLPISFERYFLTMGDRGRNLREVNFDTDANGLRIGRFQAIDYYGDGSFYLLDAPGVGDPSVFCWFLLLMR